MIEPDFSSLIPKPQHAPNQRPQAIADKPRYKRGDGAEGESFPHRVLGRREVEILVFVLIEHYGLLTALVEELLPIATALALEWSMLWPLPFVTTLALLLADA